MAIAAFRRGRQLFSTRAISSIVKLEAFPGKNITTDSQIWEVIKRSANSVYNPVGTNQMGKVDDPKAVVDNKGRVFGVKGLRVVDASIFPFLPHAQPSATVCGFCPSLEKASSANKLRNHRCLGRKDFGEHFTRFLKTMHMPSSTVDSQSDGLA